jgi:serine/threonine protein kinase/predicted ATPase
MSELPRAIGPYRIVEALGRGGMGVVYRAEHRGTGQAVALKTVRAPREGLLRSIRREIHALARIRHPGIVRILDEGLHEGLPWYAMELLEGTTLGHAAAELHGRRAQLEPAQTAAQPLAAWWTHSVARSGPWPACPGAEAEPLSWSGHARRRGFPPQVLTLVRRLCSALAYLHGEGIVHRDLKPDNVLLRAASGERRAASEQPEAGAGLAARSSQLAAFPVLVDFGLMTHWPLAAVGASALHAGGGGELGREAIEHDSGAAGTVAYMAPEQIRGELVDARADLYALGCILYELVAGRPPFGAASAAELQRLHLEQEPPPLGEAVEGVAPELEELVRRLLAKRPQDRLGHADDVAAVLAGLGAEDGWVEAGPKPRAYLYRPRFAGRSEALQILTQQLGQASAGALGLTLIGGESGVGKTRLALELAREARMQGLCVLSGECQPLRPAAEPDGRAGPGGGAPLHALRPALRAIADRCLALGLAETERLLGPRGKLLALYEPALAGLSGQEAYPEPAELSAEAARLRLWRCLAETLAAFAQDPAGPHSSLLTPHSSLLTPHSSLLTSHSSLLTPHSSLLILDDLQWADELTVGFLQHLLRDGQASSGGPRSQQLPETEARSASGRERSERTPAIRHRGQTPVPASPAAPLEWHGLLVVGVYRSEEIGEPLQRLLQAPAVRHLRLERLEERAIGAMVGDMLSLWPAPEQFVRFVSRHSEGNPFFVTEYLRTAVAEQLLYRDAAGRWHAAVDGAGAGEMPYAELPLPRALQQLVARRLDGLSETARELVDAASVLGREPDEAALAAMVALNADQRMAAVHELLARGVLEEPGGGRLRFAHDKLREVAHGRLDAARRRGLHRAAAEALESGVTAGPDEPTASMTALAQHWDEAGERAKARSCYLSAARQMKGRYVHGEAERLYRAHLRISDRPSSESLLARIELGKDILRAQGRVREAIEQYELAVAEARQLGDRAAEGQALNLLGTGHVELDLPAEAAALYEQALGIHREAGDRQAEARTLGDLASLASDRSQPREAQALFEQALAALGEDDVSTNRGMILSNFGTLHSQQGRSAQAHALYEQALAVFRAIGDRRAEGIALGNIASQLRVRGDVQQARTLYEQALAIHREVGNRRFEGVILYHLSDLHREHGRLPEARALCEQALGIHREVGNRQAEGLGLIKLAHLTQELGCVDEARSLYDQALSLCQELGLRRLVGIHHVLRASLERRLGQLDAAERLVQQAERLFQDLHEKLWTALYLCEKGHIALARARPAAELLHEAEQRAAALGAGPSSPPGLALGRLRRAVEAFDAGRPLVHGEHSEDLPQAWHRRRVELGQPPP